MEYRIIVFLIFIVDLLVCFDSSVSHLYGSGDRSFGSDATIQVSTNDTHFVTVGYISGSSNSSENGLYIAKIRIPKGGEIITDNFSMDHGIEVLWSKFLSSTSTSYFKHVIETSDGCFAAIGKCYGYSNESNGDIIVTKFSPSGVVLMSIIISKTGSISHGRSIFEARNGDFLITGTMDDSTTNEDIYIARISSSGQLIWSNVFGGDEIDYSRDIIEMSQTGDIIIFGETEGPYSKNHFLVMKLTSDGTQVWNRTLTISMSYSQVSGSVIESYDHHIIFTGTSKYPSASSSYVRRWVIFHKMNETNGNTIWSRRGGKKRYYSYATQILETNDTNHDLIIVGSRLRYSTEMIFMKLSSSGNLKTITSLSKSGFTEDSTFVSYAKNRDGFVVSGEIYETVSNVNYAYIGIISSNIDVCETSPTSFSYFYDSSSYMMVTTPVNNFRNLNDYYDTRIKYFNTSSLHKFQNTNTFAMKKTFCTFCRMNDTAPFVRRTLQNQNSFCDQNGYCNDIGECTCNFRYTGNDTYSCDTYDQGPYCGTYRFDNNYACSSNGKCVGEDDCDCDKDYKVSSTGNYCWSDYSSTADRDHEEWERQFLSWFIPMMVAIMCFTVIIPGIIMLVVFCVMMCVFLGAPIVILLFSGAATATAATAATATGTTAVVATTNRTSNYPKQKPASISYSRPPRVKIPVVQVEMKDTKPKIDDFSNDVEGNLNIADFQDFNENSRDDEFDQFQQNNSSTSLDFQDFNKEKQKVEDEDDKIFANSEVTEEIYSSSV